MAAGSLEWARPAVPADAPRLAELWDEADAEIGVQRGGERLVGSITRPSGLDGGDGGDRALLDDAEGLVVVGGIDDAVLGFASASLDRRRPVPLAALQVVFVERDARAVGIGEAMVGLIIGWAAGQGCAGLDAYALPGSRAAKAFFEDNGFTARLLTMYRPLRPDG